MSQPRDARKDAFLGFAEGEEGLAQAFRIASHREARGLAMKAAIQPGQPFRLRPSSRRYRA